MDAGDYHRVKGNVVIIGACKTDCESSLRNSIRAGISTVDVKMHGVQRVGMNVNSG